MESSGLHFETVFLRKFFRKRMVFPEHARKDRNKNKNRRKR